MANDQAINGQPQQVDNNRNSRADLENVVGTPDPTTQESSDDQQQNNTDATISNNARPATDDTVVEGIDEANPGVTGSPRPDAVPTSKASPETKQHSQS